MIRISAVLSLTALLGACGYVSEYEKAVYDWEPTYCYKSIGGVACYKDPYPRDERRMVNYFGPDPSRYDKPDAPEATPFDPQAVEARLERIQGMFRERLSLGQSLLIEQLVAMDDEERAAYADRLVERKERRHNRD